MRIPFLLAAVMIAGVGALPAPPPRPALPQPPSDALAISAERASSLFVEGAEVVGALSLRAAAADFGGLSGLTVSDDGARLLAVSDRGGLFQMRLRREAGTLRDVDQGARLSLRDARGRIFDPGGIDPEDLAIAPDGALAVSFEGSPARVLRYGAPGGKARELRLPPRMRALQANSGLEAIAIDHTGAFYALPERSGALTRPFPVWRLKAGRWSEAAWPREEDYLVTGADIGPDGRLYVTERAFTMLGGFRWRLKSADLADWPKLTPRLEAQQAQGGFDNIEGVSIWRAPDGSLRALLIADDNFIALQRTLLLELKLSQASEDEPS